MIGNTTIVIGNGFDLDLGWQTSYRDFYEAHKGWHIFESETDDLFQYVINHAADNWFDFEKTLYDYAIHRSETGFTSDLVNHDFRDYDSFKTLLEHFLSERSSKPVKEKSFAYRLLEAYIDICKEYQPKDNKSLKWFSFNYTPLSKVAKKINPFADFTYVPVHGTLERKNIIFGVHDDENIKHEYRFLQKSMDDNYESHGILPTLLDSNQIIFFGLSMGKIDAIYFKELFNQLSTISSNQTIRNKEIIFITKDAETKKSIKSNLIDMVGQAQLLINNCKVDFILTSSEENNKNNTKFEALISRLYNHYML